MDKPLDERAIAILADVLDRTSGSLEGLDVKRYRVDHTDNLERIDYLTGKHLLELDRDHQTFRVGHVGLFFIQSLTRQALLADIDRVIDYLGTEYKTNLDQPVLLASIAKALKLKRARVEECLSYIQRGLALGMTTNLRKPDADVVPTEKLIGFGTMETFLEKRARAWFPQAFEDKKTKAKPHGNTEVNAIKREQVLGAAITAITHWPEACRRGDSFNGYRIATLIDQKAPLWWQEGVAPLSIDRMTRLINEHLKLPV
jgi:hypothetical protein